MRTTLVRILSAFALLVASAISNFAAPGALDITFNGTGKVTTPMGTGGDFGNAIAIQPDGKIVVAGSAFIGTDDDFALVRYNVDGSLDPTFNGTGKVNTPIGSGNEAALGVAIQGDGKIVATGYSWNGADFDFALVRYNLDGSLDTTFNGTGKVTTPIGPGQDIGRSVAIQGDGKIVVAGSAFIGTDDDFALVRYNANGSLDTTFNGTGKVTTPIGNSNELAYSIAIQNDGKIVVAGSVFIGTDDDFALVRYNVDGSLDPTFNATGKVNTPIGSSNEAALGVAIQGDGKIVATGYSWSGANFDFALVRYNLDGSLDTTVNGSGKVTTSIGPISDLGRSVAIQGDGKIVVAGEADNGALRTDIALVRYLPNGSLDATFNGTGKVITPMDAVGNSRANGVAVQGDGKIVVAGSAVFGGFADFAVVRYLGTVSRDLNSDLHSDLLFQNGIGQIAAWYLNGSGGTASAEYIYLGALGVWRVVGVADMNNDGNADILFQSTIGQICAWYLNGSGAVSSAAYLCTVGLADWRVVGVADMNGDRNTDVIFQNNVGQIVVWFTNGTGALTTAVILYPNGLGDWRVVASADLNNDSNADLMLNRKSPGSAGETLRV